MVTEPTLKKLLLVLAQEESTHKERLENSMTRTSWNGFEKTMKHKEME